MVKSHHRYLKRRLIDLIKGKKKLSKALVLSIMFTFIFSSVAFAQPPSNSLLVGTKSYSIAYLTRPGAVAEVNAALQAMYTDTTNLPLTNQRRLYIRLKTSGDVFKYSVNKSVIPDTAKQTFPTVVFKDANGLLTDYTASFGGPAVLGTTDPVAETSSLLLTPGADNYFESEVNANDTASVGTVKISFNNPINKDAIKLYLITGTSELSSVATEVTDQTVKQLLLDKFGGGGSAELTGTISAKTYDVIKELLPSYNGDKNVDALKFVVTDTNGKVATITLAIY